MKTTQHIKKFSESKKVAKKHLTYPLIPIILLAE